MTLYVDAKEPDRLYKKLHRKHISVEKKFMEVGDYLLGDGIIIERKDGNDFLSSIKDNRIWEQASNLSQAENPIIAVISENIWRDMYFRRGKYAHKSYYGALATLTRQYDISVMLFADEHDFISYIKTLEKQISSNKESSRPAPIMRKAKSMKTRRENCLCAAKGISVKMAEKLLENFDTVEDIATASTNDFKKIDGIGKAKAKNVYKLFH